MNKKITVATGCNIIITDLNQFFRNQTFRNMILALGMGVKHGLVKISDSNSTPDNLFLNRLFQFCRLIFYFYLNYYFEISYFTISYFNADFPGKNDPKWPFSA